MKLTSRENNYAQLRKAVNQSNLPCVPYLGMFLLDLSFISEASPVVVEGRDQINFKSCSKISNVIGDIKNYQQAPYDFLADLTTQFLLRNSKYDVACYLTSIRVEPRNTAIN